MKSPGHPRHRGGTPDDPNDASDDAVVEDEGDEDAVAGPIAIAVDVNEADSTPANADNPTP